jgi:hypothetical protein
MFIKNNVKLFFEPNSSQFLGTLIRGISLTLRLGGRKSRNIAYDPRIAINRNNTSINCPDSGN